MGQTRKVGRLLIRWGGMLSWVMPIAGILLLIHPLPSKRAARVRNETRSELSANLTSERWLGGLLDIVEINML